CPGSVMRIDGSKHDKPPQLEEVLEPRWDEVADTLTDSVGSRPYTRSFLNFKFAGVKTHIGHLALSGERFSQVDGGYQR
ncbi:MAG TPA: hypothetical protein VJN94_10720, partial [Candidatus Binataceae bacterium]|nr:hypothetical protein [Candidatus Binataceae bacterium]